MGALINFVTGEHPFTPKINILEIISIMKALY